MSHTSPDLRRAVPLVPVHIPKPWGQEIWFTGMEARGESAVEYHGRHLPLSDYLALDPAATCASQDVLLLKILDPDPAPVTGDLYFELHEEKREVYVVTHVDRTAWPDGVGGIRFGMDQLVRRSYRDDDAFRFAFATAVAQYETVRRRIDAAPGAAPDASLRDDERRLREEMEAFTHTRGLGVGDVVRVPTLTPHALQHGVRVVEFQTPTYERLIISFAQRVLTQDHWDTDAAVAQMHLDAPEPETFEPVAPGVLRIARFDDFNVWRLDLDQQAVALPQGLPYAVCMGLTGSARIGELELAPEQACLVPCAALANTQVGAEGSASLLVAAPGL